MADSFAEPKATQLDPDSFALAVGNAKHWRVCAELWSRLRRSQNIGTIVAIVPIVEDSFAEPKATHLRKNFKQSGYSLAQA